MVDDIVRSRWRIERVHRWHGDRRLCVSVRNSKRDLRSSSNTASDSWHECAGIIRLFISYAFITRHQFIHNYLLYTTFSHKCNNVECRHLHGAQQKVVWPNSIECNPLLFTLTHPRRHRRERVRTRTQSTAHNIYYTHRIHCNEMH